MPCWVLARIEAGERQSGENSSIAMSLVWKTRTMLERCLVSSVFICVSKNTASLEIPRTEKLPLD